MPENEAVITVDANSLNAGEMEAMIRYMLSEVDATGNPKPMGTPFIWGAPGIGKTGLTNSIAESMGARMVAIHLPQYDPTDLSGIPFLIDGDVRMKSMSYLPATKVTTFTDELLASYKKSGLAKLSAKFMYAEDVSVVVTDVKGKVKARFNAPSSPDMNATGISINQTDSHSFDVSLSGVDINRLDQVHIEDKAFLFLDELSLADVAVQKVALQMVLDRHVGEYDLPISTPVAAAGNRETDGAFVQPMSHPLANRFAHFTMVPDFKGWRDWAAGHGVHPAVISFVIKLSKVFEYDPTRLGNGKMGFMTPRTLKMLSDQYVPVADMATHLLKTGGAETRSEAKLMAEKLQKANAVGIIGAARGSEFITFVNNFDRLPDIDQIANGTLTDYEPDVEMNWAMMLLLTNRIKATAEEFASGNMSDASRRAHHTAIMNNLFTFMNKNFRSQDILTFAIRTLLKRHNIPLVTLRCPAFADMVSENNPRGRDLFNLVQTISEYS